MAFHDSIKHSPQSSRLLPIGHEYNGSESMLVAPCGKHLDCTFDGALDIEKNPFRSIGVVAATLAFIVSVAIILTSFEVSRISAAT